MIELLSDQGRNALRRLLDGPAVFGFDFDGTLAPIRARPDEVFMAPAMAEAFAELTARLPVAVITGRGVADVEPRLAGTPRWVVGNHGAEGLPGADPARLAAQAAACADWRRQLEDMGLGSTEPQPQSGEGEGIFLEDKTYTLCLHYRLAPDHAAAQRLLAERVQTLAPAPRIVSGKCVLNLLPEGSADKFAALARLAGGFGGNAFFIGDDDTDEAVFAQAPASWITVRVGSGRPSAARFRIPDQEAVLDCLGLLLALAGSRGVA